MELEVECSSEVRIYLRSLLYNCGSYVACKTHHKNTASVLELGTLKIKSKMHAESFVPSRVQVSAVVSQLYDCLVFSSTPVMAILAMVELIVEYQVLGYSKHKLRMAIKGVARLADRRGWPHVTLIRQLELCV